MKNIYVFIIFSVLITIFIFSGCQESPDGPGPSPTDTPTPLFVDDFEDGGDFDNLYSSTWTTSAGGGTSAIDIAGEYTGAEKNGSYSFRVSGHAQTNSDSGESYYYGNFNMFSNGPTPVDITEYNKLKFSAYMGGAPTVGSAYPVLWMLIRKDAGSSASIQAASGYDPVFKEYSLDLNAFAASGATLEDIYAASKTFTIYIEVKSANYNDEADIQFYIDDIRFTN